MQVEALRSGVSWSRFVILNLGMEIAHLWIILNTETIGLISANSQSTKVNCYVLIPGWSLEYMQFDHILLWCRDYLELAESHLKHHIGFKQYFLSNHHKWTSCWPNVPHVELAHVRVISGHSTVAVDTGGIIWIVLNLTVSARYETFWDYYIIGSWVSA